MGYDITIEGEISIEPPLTWRQVAGSAFLGAESGLHLKITEEHVDTDEGVLLRRTADAIGASDYPGGYLRDLQEIVEAHPKHTFAGWLEIFGEEPGDISRVGVVKGKVVTQRAAIIWPGDPGYDKATQ